MSLFSVFPFYILSLVESSVHPANIMALLSPVFTMIYAALIIYLLIYKADFFAGKIVGSQQRQQTQIWWLPFAFRLTAVFAGILYLYWVVPTMISTIHSYIMAVHYDFEDISSYLSWNRILSWVILLAIGVYLLCGAPHFVRWQVKKTLEQCKKSDELQESSRA